MNSSLHLQLFLKGQKYPAEEYPSNFSTFCERIIRKFKGNLYEKWDLVLLSEKADNNNKIISNQEDYNLMLKLSHKEGLKGIEIRESKRSDCTSAKFNDKENFCEISEGFDFEKIEKDVKKSKKEKAEKNRGGLQERDCNIPRGEELEFPLKNSKKEDPYQNKEIKDEELQKRIEGNLKSYGFDNIEQLQAEAMEVQLEEAGLDELLAASQERETMNSQRAFLERYSFVKEAYEKGLEDFGLRNLDDVKEELEYAIRDEQRFKAVGRLSAAEKEQLKIQGLKKLIALFEEIEKHELEEEQRQDEQRKQEKLAFFRKGLEELDLTSLQDVEDDLKAARQEAERLENRPGREKALQDAQRKIQKLDDLLQAGKDVEKFLLEEEFKKHQKEIKEKEAALKMDLESLQLNCIEDVKEDLKAAIEEAKRLENRRGRERNLQDAQKRVTLLEGLMKKWEEIERLKTEEKERQSQLNREEQEDNPPRYLENPASSDIVEPSVREEIPPFDEPILEANQDAEVPSDPEKQNIKTKLENLNEEVNSMPNCFEKFLILLNILVLRKFYSEYTELESSEFVDGEISKVLDSLTKRAEIEMLNTKSMKCTLDEISLNIRNKTWEPAKKSLILLLKQIQPLSIAETKILIKKGSEAAALVRGKDAILFIGETGAGKSTTLLYLSGAKIIKKLLAQGYHYLPVEINNSHLVGVTTSASSASETRYIKCVPVQLMDIGIPKKGCAYFLDLPGYDDSAGAEVDISNAVNILRTIGECKSVKPLVLISNKSLGERMKGIKKLARILTGMLPGLKQNTENSPFIYLFTKFSNEEAKFVEGKIKDVLAKLNPEEEADDGFCNILEDIIYKIGEGIQTIDPLASEEAKKVLRRILDSSSISQPDQAFKFSIAEDSKATLHKQCTLMHETIRSATERMDFELANYKLSQLKELKDLVDLEFIEKSYLKSIEFVRKFLQENYQTSVERFTRCLQDGDTLKEQDIRKFIENMEHAQAADFLRNEYFAEDVPASSAFTQTVTVQTKKLLIKIQKSSITDLSLESQLEKLQLLSLHFENMKSELEDSIRYLKTMLNEEIESFKSLHLKDEFDESMKRFENISSFMERMKVYLNEDFVQEKKNMIEEFLIVDIEGTVSGLETVFHKNRIDPEDGENLKKRLTRLGNMKERYKTQLDTIKSAHQGIKEKILDYLEKIKEKITKLHNEEKYDSLSDVERLFKEIVLLREIPGIAHESTTIYDEAFSSLRGISNQVKNDIVEEIKKCQNNQTDDDFDYGNLRKYLLALQSMSWMDDGKQEIVGKTKRTIEREVMKHSETHKKQLEKLELDLDNHGQLERANQIVSKLKEMLVFQETLPILSQNKDIIREHFEEKVEVTLNVIQSHLDSWKSSSGKSLDKKRIEKSLLYLQRCNGLSLFKQKSPILLQELEDFIESSSQRDSEQLDKCYHEIMSYNGTQNTGELGNSIRTSIVFTQAQDDPGSNSELSDNISSVSERVEMNPVTDKERLVQKAQTMSKLLKQAIQFQRDFQNLSRIYETGDEPIIDLWKARLNSDLKDLSGEMLKLSTSVNRSQELQKKLYIARALSLLDEFIEGEKFINIYEKYQAAHYAQTAKKFSEYIENVKNGDYGPIAKNIKSFRKLNREEMACYEQYDELKDCLSESFENLMVDTISLTQQAFIDKGLLHTSKIASIEANINKLRKAKDCFEPQDLCFSIDKFQECIDKVRKIISQELERIVKEYQSLICLQSFTEAELLRLRLSQICKFLGEKWEEDLKQKTSELDKIRQEGVGKIVKSFKERSIWDYFYHSPKKVYSRLELGRDDHFYKHMLESFRILIENKCWDEMKRIESLDITQRSDSLKRIQSLLADLPQPVEANLSKKLEELEGDLNKVRQNYNSELQSVKKNGNTRNRVDLLKRLKEMKMEQGLKDLEEHIEKETQQLKSEIMKNLHSKNIEQALKQFEELAEKNTDLDSQDINSIYLEVRTNLMQIVQNWFTSFVKGLNLLDTIVSDKVNGGEVEQNFVCLMELLKFKKDSSKVPHLLEDLLSNAQGEEMNKVIIDRIKNYQRSCSEAFDNFDFSKISKIRKFAKNCDSLFGYFKAYAMDHADQYPDLSSLSSILEEVECEASLEEKLSLMVNQLGEEVSNVELVNNETKKFSKSRDEFYSQLNQKLSNLEKAKKFEGLDFDVKSLFKRSCERINSQKEEMYQVLEQLVEQIWENDIQREEYEQFNIYYNNLIAIKKNLKFLKSNSFDFEVIERTFKRKIGIYVQEIQNEKDSQLLKKMAEGLIKLKALSLNMSVFKSYTEAKINDILNSYKTTKGTANIPKLAKLLTLDQKGYGSSVVSDCQVFKGVANEIFNSRTQKHKIDYVLKNLRGSDISTDLLGKRYEKFHEIYKQLTDTYLKPNIDLSDLVYKTKLLAGNTNQTNEEIHWSSEMVAKVPELLAHIFAIWTLQNAGGYFETDDSMNKQNYLLQPHAAQVISIFRLLGVGDKALKLQNNLAQIGTGEGKSITLAVTAIVLALFGFNVFSACYSFYLCDRDYNAFSSLFKLLDVSEQIKYGTFNKICEDVINQDGDIRKLVENLFTCKDANFVGKNKSNCPSILLIDEVDVFFSQEFYGRLYTPSASIQDPTITKLFDLIWQNRKSQCTFLQVKETQEYQDCCAQFPDFKNVIEEAVKDMLYDIKVFESHDYIVKDDKIGYKQCENISFKIRCRYQTLFAYYLENERDNISPESLEENKKLILKCGSFSYAEVIKQFKFIMGVTGTLEHLSEMEKQVITNEYQIKKNTFLPSVFGENKLKYAEKEDVITAKEIDYFNTLRTEIIDRLNSGKAKDTKRAVLVFFESDKKLLEFLNSNQMADMKDQIEYLTEEANAEEKENIVKRATSSGRITFFTRSFGRGTDFVVHDQEVSANGGIHVLQTFLSEERSEEVQIKGRTARQGDQGSFSMVLLDLSLEKFSILPEDIEKVKKEGKAWYRVVRELFLDPVEYKNVYQLMNARRDELFARGYKNNEKCVIQARDMHREAMKFLQDISSRDMDAIRLFLVKENKGVSEAKKSRTIIATDGTYSMNALHQNTQTTIKKTCTNITPILKENGIAEDCFQLQFVVFRNYDSKEDKLLQFSTWETKPNALTPFLESIAVEGGWGNEAIEVAFSYANQQHEKEPISQIILIGDAAANSEKEVEIKRERLGEDYWNTTKFATKTNYKEEITKLKLNGIPVHSFYMKESAKENFTEISNATGGKCAPLDIYSDAGATALTNLVTEVLLKQIGEQNGKGDELVQAFRNKVIQSYSE